MLQMTVMDVRKESIAAHIQAVLIAKYVNKADIQMKMPALVVSGVVRENTYLII